MKISSDSTKYTYSWRYVELAKHIPSLNRIIREKVDGIPILLDVNDVQKYARKYSNTGIYTSVTNGEPIPLPSNGGGGGGDGGGGGVGGGGAAETTIRI